MVVPGVEGGHSLEEEVLVDIGRGHSWWGHSLEEKVLVDAVKVVADDPGHLRGL